MISNLTYIVTYQHNREHCTVEDVVDLSLRMMGDQVEDISIIIGEVLDHLEKLTTIRDSGLIHHKICVSHLI